MYKYYNLYKIQADGVTGLTAIIVAFAENEDQALVKAKVAWELQEPFTKWANPYISLLDKAVVPSPVWFEYTEKRVYNKAWILDRG